jgi:hypothetical protein
MLLLTRRCGSKPLSRYITTKIDLPIVSTVEEATACIAQIGSLAAAGKLALDEANDLVGYQKAFIEAKIGTDPEQRLLDHEHALQNANINLGVRVEGGMPERDAAAAGKIKGIVNNDDRIHTAVGLSIADSIALTEHADFYFCHHGTVRSRPPIISRLGSLHVRLSRSFRSISLRA